jgi:hypothetical protein
VTWFERQVRRLDRFQQRHVVIAFPWAVVQKFGNDQAGGKAALMAYYGLFALFPLLLLFATLIGYALPGNPELQAKLIDSALGNPYARARQIPLASEVPRTSASPAQGDLSPGLDRGGVITSHPYRDNDRVAKGCPGPR